MAPLEIVRLDDATITVHINPETGVVWLKFLFTLKDGERFSSAVGWLI